MFARCPNCQHRPLPENQALPVACPACGVILAKVEQARQKEKSAVRGVPHIEVSEALASPLFDVPTRVDAIGYWLRAALLVGFCVWGLWLIWLDYRTGAIGSSFIHGPLLVFHEAGHVLFRPFGEWMTMLGGTLGQLLMPALLGGALLLKNRDPYGAAIGLWLLGVSVLDVAPYMYDALDPQLMLLSGTTGEDGGHDWIYLFSSMGLLHKAQTVGAITHTLGALIVLLALAWAAWVLRLQRGHLAGDVLSDR